MCNYLLQYDKFTKGLYLFFFNPYVKRVGRGRYIFSQVPTPAN